MDEIFVGAPLSALRRADVHSVSSIGTFKRGDMSRTAHVRRRRACQELQINHIAQNPRNGLVRELCRLWAWVSLCLVTTFCLQTSCTVCCLFLCSLGWTALHVTIVWIDAYQRQNMHQSIQRGEKMSWVTRLRTTADSSINFHSSAAELSRVILPR